MINIFEVKETNNMVEHENLDVRTITIGISLLSCIDSDLKKLNENIYNRITSVAKDLAKVAGEIEAEYGIPIVNKRISVTPIALIGGAACKTPEDFATIADTMDRAAEAIGADLIGGYSALVSKGMTKADEMLIRSIPIALCRTNRVCSSVNLASTKTGINMDAVRLMGEILLEVAERSKDRDSVDCMKLVVFCNAPDDNPFMAGAFHGVTEADVEFPIPFMPPFLKFDFSTLPALIGGFAYGPVTGIAIAFIKAALHLLRTDTGGVGELADFLASGSLVLVSSLIYKRIKTRKGAVLGLVLGAIAMAIVGGLANYFILIPFYTNVMPMEQIISLCGKANPLITNTLGYVLYGAIPFNLIKALLLSIITFVLYKQISKILH